MNANYYINKYNFPNFDVDDYFDIRENIVLDFKVCLGVPNRMTFKHFEQCVYSVMILIDKLAEMTNGKFNSNLLWQNMFGITISSIGIKYFSSSCHHKRFLDLMYFYAEENIERRKIMANEVVAQKLDPSDKKLLLFMGLGFPYTKNQLKKRFRKLAIAFHPDKSSGDTTKFIYLKQCFEALNKNF